MKKLISLLICGLMLISMFAMSGFTTERRAEKLPNFDEIIKLYMDSDGAQAEGLSYDLHKLFVANPKDFINVLITYPTDVQETVMSSVATYAVYASQDEKTVFEKTLYSLDVTDEAIVALIKTYEATIANKTEIIDDGSAIIPLFDVVTVKTIVSAYIGNGSPVDEEFYNYLAERYVKDSKLLVTAIEELPKKEVEKIAIGMRLVSEKTGLDLVSSNKSNTVLDVKQEVFYKEFDKMLSDDVLLKRIESSQDIFKAESSSPSKAPAAPTPTIGALYYLSTPTVGGTSNLAVPLTVNTQTNTVRRYTIKVYCIRNGQEWLKNTVYASMPVGTTSGTFNVPISFSNPGTFFTRVVVHDYITGAILNQRTGSTSDVVRGYWRINVFLKTNRDIVGSFGLYDAAGDLKVSGSALGKSARGKAMDQFEGHTPTGNYTADLGPVQGNTTSYGPYKVVRLYGDNNPLVPSKRDGIWIHGGQSQTSLSATYGCVRVFNSDQLRIENSITSMCYAVNGHYAIGRCTIYQSQ